MTPADISLERLIAAATSALTETRDPRFAQAQKYLAGLRSAEQAEHMGRAHGIVLRRKSDRLEWIG